MGHCNFKFVNFFLSGHKNERKKKKKNFEN